MNREDVLAELTPICRVVFNDPDLLLTESLDATQVSSWTSLTYMQLLTRVEQQYGFKFRMLELLGMRTIGNLVDVILSHQ